MFYILKWKKSSFLVYSIPSFYNNNNKKKSHFFHLEFTSKYTWSMTNCDSMILKTKPLVGVYINWTQHAQIITKCHIEKLRLLYTQCLLPIWNAQLKWEHFLLWPKQIFYLTFCANIEFLIPIPNSMFYILQILQASIFGFFHL